MRPTTLFSWCLAALIPAMPVRGQIVVNEVMAVGSDRLLQWSAAGVPKLGFGTSWNAPSFDDATWLSGNGPLALAISRMFDRLRRSARIRPRRW